MMLLKVTLLEASKMPRDEGPETIQGIDFILDINKPDTEC
jgi:hypothetical protein